MRAGKCSASVQVNGSHLNGYRIFFNILLYRKKQDAKLCFWYAAICVKGGKCFFKKIFIACLCMGYFQKGMEELLPLGCLAEGGVG